MKKILSQTYNSLKKAYNAFINNDAGRMISYFFTIIFTLIIEPLLNSALNKLILISFLILVSIWIFIYYVKKHNPKSVSRYWGTLFTVIVIIGTYYLFGNFSIPKKKCENPKVLRDYFDCSYYPDKSTITAGVKLTSIYNRVVKIEYSLVADFKAMSCYSNVYIPADKETIQICEYVAMHTDSIVIFNKNKIGKYEEGSPPYSTQKENLFYTRRVFVYHETPLLTNEIEYLKSYFLKYNLYVLFYGADLKFVNDKDKFIWRIDPIPDNLRIP